MAQQNKWDSTIYWNSVYTWGGGALVDFEWEANYVYNESIGFKTTIFLTDGGKEVRYSKGVPHRQFALDFIHRSGTTINEIEDFYDIKQGTCTSFYWENPNDSIIYEVRFKDDSFEKEIVDYNVYNARVTLVEVI